ncbi:MAG: DUF6067 family protein [Puniceicoccales bacterium]|nr:DUF6067 family protein [Puniceicoccales bacterium]
MTASGTYGKQKPELAVDGDFEKQDKHWACENLPVWLQVDMEAIKTLSSIRIWPYWADGRIYKFKIEGSSDGKNWNTLVDQSGNSITGTAEGFEYSFAPARVRYVRTTILENSIGQKNGGHIVEIQGFEAAPKTGLNARAAAIDSRFEKNILPKESDTLDRIQNTAWRGERVNGRLVLWANNRISQVRLIANPLVGPGGKTIPVQASFLRYTQGKGKLYADIIDENTKYLDIPAGTVRSGWLTVDVPAETTPGLYKGEIIVQAAGGVQTKVPVEINVLPATLPAPQDWIVHLDLWQHPEAVARWHGVKSWSPEHLALMRPIMKRLADAGQKVITCSLIDEAWNGQTFDWWPSMVEWTKGRDGVMRYDYTNFDKYVDFMTRDVGIKGQISCYTMVPWSLKIKYFDETTGDYEFYALKPGEKSYEDIWGPFLSDFRDHVKAKGWLDITCMSLDERPDKMVRAALDVIKKYAPEFRLVSAVNRPSATSDIVYDMSPIFQHMGSLTPEMLKERKSTGKKTTFYVCTSPPIPNTFLQSPLSEAEWLGLFAAANDLDGFLRWAYNSWSRDPFDKADFGNWAAGDCFLVYPGNLSSIRFERLRDGLENFEKINILRRKAQTSGASAEFKNAVQEMNQELKTLFTVPRGRGNQHTQDVQRANELINKVTVTR